MKMPTSTKHLKISQAQSTVLMVLAASIVVSIFCLVSSKALLSQVAYQRKVLHARREALKKLETDETAAKQLADQYHQVFIGSQPVNIIGGKNTTDSSALPPDGDNARIVLDALPSSYDFPALITSVNKILSLNGLSAASINSADESATLENKPSASPQPTTLLLTASASGNYAVIQRLVKDFERSIRPFDITSMQLSGNGSQISITLSLSTYYQPAKSFDIQSKVVK
jgi:hypothetical protein